MADDRRATLEAIAFGSDPRISPSDRVRAIEQLGQLPPPLAEWERLSPEQAAEELASLAAAVPGMLAVAAGPDAVEAPVEVAELREVVDLQQRLIEQLEVRLGERERALQRAMVQRLLVAAPGPLS